MNAEHLIPDIQQVISASNASSFDMIFLPRLFATKIGATASDASLEDMAIPSSSSFRASFDVNVGSDMANPGGVVTPASAPLCLPDRPMDARWINSSRNVAHKVASTPTGSACTPNGRLKRPKSESEPSLDQPAAAPTKAALNGCAIVALDLPLRSENGQLGLDPMLRGLRNRLAQCAFRARARVNRQADFASKSHARTPSTEMISVKNVCLVIDEPSQGWRQQDGTGKSRVWVTGLQEEQSSL